VSTLALWFTFRDRGPWETMGAAVALGLAISAMHYVAMMATSFTPTGEVVIIPGSALTQHNLAFIVAIATFLICGLFLVIALPDQKRAEDKVAELEAVAASGFDNSEAAAPPKAMQPAVRIPVRRNQSIFFAEPDMIIAIRADGHYTWISLTSSDGGIDEYFCERPISALAKLLAAPPFVRSHRSHLVNIEHVQGFRRQGDGGLLLLKARGEEVSIPVSRSNIRQVLTLLECRPDLPPTLPQAAHA
jgi:DNA-binding LytR/AlgR family response regulator